MTIEHAPSATDLLKDPPVSARQDGSFTVTNTRNALTRTYGGRGK